MLSEPLARLGAKVTGIDPIKRNIEIAKHHLKKSKLDIKYYNFSTETFISNIIPSTTDKQLIDPTKKNITIPYESTIPLTNNSLTEVKGKFELKNGTYIFNVSEQKVLMNDWGDFKF